MKHGRVWTSLLVLGMLMAGAGPAEADMPSAQGCAAGTSNGVTLGRHVGVGTVCVGAAGHDVVYVGGSPAQICGTVTVADQSAASTDPNTCDGFGLPVRDRLDFQIVLPSGYTATTIRYPVLYLLSAGRTSEWPRVDGHLQAIADQGMIIVLPNEGLGWYTRWFDGSHDFDKLDSTELIGYVDSHYRTIADRGHRAVAGFSKAGYGAFLLAARHPDLYGAAASFSGLLDEAAASFRFFYTTVLATDLATYADPLGAPDNNLWGNPVTQAVYWRDMNPLDLVGNLRGLELFNAAGDGLPTPAEASAPSPTIALDGASEAQYHAQNIQFNAAARRAGVAHTWQPHHGVHDAALADASLHAWLPTLTATFAHPAPSPAIWSYRTADPTFSVWGWSFRADPARAMEFLDVSSASARGLTLTGSGTATVTTAPLFRPRETVDVSGVPARADDEGRLTFPIDLGPAHTTQQYTPQADAMQARGGYFTTRTVTFTR